MNFKKPREIKCNNLKIHFLLHKEFIKKVIKRKKARQKVRRMCTERGEKEKIEKFKMVKCMDCDEQKEKLGRVSSVVTFLRSWNI